MYDFLNKTSFIIPYRRASEDREKNLFLFLDFLKKKVPGVEIIIVEQSYKGDFYIKEIDGVNIVKCEIGESFNKSFLMNVGAWKSKKDFFFFCDIDVIFDIDELLNYISSIDDFDFLAPFTHLYFLDEFYSSLYKSFPNFKNIINHISLRLDKKGCPLSGGCCIFKRSSFYKIGGFPSFFYGWGCEDEYMDYMVQNYLNPICLNIESFHLFHSVEIDYKYKNKNFISNIEILDYIIDQPKDFHEKIFSLLDNYIEEGGIVYIDKEKEVKILGILGKKEIYKPILNEVNLKYGVNIDVFLKEDFLSYQVIPDFINFVRIDTMEPVGYIGFKKLKHRDFPVALKMGFFNKNRKRWESFGEFPISCGMLHNMFFKQELINCFYIHIKKKDNLLYVFFRFCNRKRFLSILKMDDFMDLNYIYTGDIKKKDYIENIDGNILSIPVHTNIYVYKR